jgi:hypothetical protein
MRRPFLLSLVLFGSCAYFYEGGGWNQNTRFDLVRAIVEQGTIRIDAFHQNTGDKAVANGHYYADKAPGASWVAVPIVATARAILRGVGRPTDSPRALMWLSYVATVTASAAPATIAGLCVFVLARHWGASPDGAAVAAMAYGLSTPVWAYGTLLFGHTLAAGCLLGAFVAADRLRDPTLDTGRSLWLGLMVGVLGGSAVLTEYPAALGAVIVAGLALVYAWRAGRRRGIRVAGAVCLGASLCAAALALYFNAAFGSPFHVSYASEEDVTLLRTGFFGITFPQPAVIAELLWGSRRGLLPLSPALIVTPFGLWHLWRRTDARLTVMAGALAFVTCLLLTAAYEKWEGGWAYGPRHLVPTLGFLCVGFAVVWDRLPGWGRVLLAIAIGYGVGCSLIGVAVTPQPPWPYMDPMRELLWPAFRAGKLAINNQSILDYGLPDGWAGLRPSGTAWNLGQFIGLRGLASLLPLITLWLACAIAWPQSSVRSPKFDVRS